MKEPAAFKPTWPEGLEQGKIYKFLCDDKGVEGTCWISVLVANDGDVHLTATERMEKRCVDHDGTEYPAIYSNFPSIRCRTGLGGGQHSRTRQALLWLADAIRRDNEELKSKGCLTGEDV
jgi:hypothetical protein